MRDPDEHRQRDNGERAMTNPPKGIAPQSAPWETHPFERFQQGEIEQQGANRPDKNQWKTIHEPLSYRF